VSHAEGPGGATGRPGVAPRPVDVTPPRPQEAAEAAGVGPMHETGRYESLPTSGWLDAVRRYFLVTKPRIIELLLVTTVPAMVVADGGWPGTWLVVATLFGGAMSAGSANAVNNYLDRDIDRLMRRTSQRPTARDEVAPGRALAFGVVLGVAGFVWLTAFTNLTAALLATGAILFYVFVYTLGMKRRTDQAVVIGGAAGCVPVLTGWAAVPGASLGDPRPWLLFALIFWWTPPHFWALAMKYREDYARAGLPMLPVTRGNEAATREILRYSYLLFAVVLMYVAGARTGWLFTTVGPALTLGWLWFAHRLRREQTIRQAMRLFHYSTSYLALVFIAAAVDAVI
jgi:protoheme IX farnesyltransferase